jgi:cytochrome c551/c552
MTREAPPQIRELRSVRLQPDQGSRTLVRLASHSAGFARAPRGRAVLTEENCLKCHEAKR